MDRGKIKQLLEELDREIPKEDALLRIHKQVKPYGNVLLGNENGLLRFGVHSLKQGLLSKSQKGDSVDSFKSEELDYLQGDELEEFIFLRNDSVQKLTLAQSQKETELELDKPTRGFIYVLVAIFCVFLLIGVYTSINWIFRFFGIDLG